MQGPFFPAIPGRLLQTCPGPEPAGPSSPRDGISLGVTVSDLLYVVLTIVVFAVLFLILKGVERFER
jgi:hypothetical protein